MSKECDIIRDLLPLYADEVVSDASREIIEEHLPGCPACREYLKQLRESELESDLKREKNAVIEYGAKRFKRRSAAVGSAVSGVFMVPILALLIVNMVSGLALGWYYVVLASLAVVASLVVVPLVVTEDKLFWTFCAFCASLMVLLGVVCLYTRGDWFGIASSATLFGLAVVFLPFIVNAPPVNKLIAGGNRALTVIGADLALFVNMMYMIRTRGRFTIQGLLFTLALMAGVALVVMEIVRRRGKR